MAVLTPISPALGGTDPTPYADADSGGDQFNGRGGAFLIHVVNGDSSSHDVVIDDPTSTAPQDAAEFDPDVVVNVPAGEERWIGIRNPRRFVNAADGLISLSYPTGATSVTLQIARM